LISKKDLSSISPPLNNTFNNIHNNNNNKSFAIPNMQLGKESSNVDNLISKQVSFENNNNKGIH
jgi:hypothetical protein